MITASNRVLDALASLEGNNFFEEVLSWIEASKDDAIKQLLLESNDATMRQLQGAASNLNEIVDTARSAKATIKKNQ